MILNFIYVFIIFSLCGESIIAFKSDSERTLNCECGVRDDFVPRIVGGRKARNGKHPWMAGIAYKGELFCGGSLINDRYILTAGHCISALSAQKHALKVYLGVTLLTDEENKLVYDVEELILHDNFQSFDTYDMQDIGLIKLKEPVKLSTLVKPVCLAEGDNRYENIQATVAGWGRLSENKSVSKFLYETEVITMANEKCKNNPIIGKKIGNTVLCAYKENTDACQGDSGGPLMYTTKTGKVEQIGVISWGIGCARPDIPGVYTRVTSYVDWIRQNTKDAKYCKTRA